MTDLIGGQVQMLLATMASSIEYVRAGKVRALAVTTRKSSDALPNIPPLTETVPGFETNDWYGIGTTKGTPSDVIDKLNKEIGEALVDPKVKDRLAVIGGVPMPTTPAEFGKLMANDAEKWSKVIRAASIKAE